MLSDINAIISIALSLSLLTTLDLFISTKKVGAFTRQGIVVLSSNIPTIYKSIKQIDDVSGSTWVSYFYPMYFIGIVLWFSLVALLIYRPLTKNLNNHPYSNKFSFFCLLYNGYRPFKKLIDEERERLLQIDNNRNESYLNICSQIGSYLIQFIDEIYELIYDDTELDGYVVYVLTRFVNIFLGKSNARFTFRQIDNTGKYMESIITTSEDEVPGPIKLSKTNLITESMTKEKPVIFSRNRDKHYSTERNSVNTGVFDDYVSYCILKTKKNKPCVSICLDVKGKDSVNKMHTLVDSMLFSIICKAIQKKYMLTYT